VPNVVLSPLSNPKHKSGPPSDQAQSLSAQILSLILTLAPDLPSSLCIERGKCVWALYIDIQFLNYDGNAIDSIWLALTSALSRTTLPPVQFNPDLNLGVVVDGMPIKVAFGGEGTFACSFVGIDEGKYILIDPDEEEEALATETVCVVIDQDQRLRYLYKGGIELKRRDIKRCIELAGERAGYLGFIVEESASKIQMSD
jgi:exosome complex component RRP43